MIVRCRNKSFRHVARSCCRRDANSFQVSYGCKALNDSDGCFKALSAVHGAQDRDSLVLKSPLRVAYERLELTLPAYIAPLPPPHLTNTSEQKQAASAKSKCKPRTTARTFPRKAAILPLTTKKPQKSTQHISCVFRREDSSILSSESFLTWLTIHCFEEPMFAATTLGAAITASPFCSRLAFRFEPGSGLCSCFRRCLNKQAQSNAW